MSSYCRQFTTDSHLNIFVFVLLRRFYHLHTFLVSCTSYVSKNSCWLQYTFIFQICIRSCSAIFARTLYFICIIAVFCARKYAKLCAFCILLLVCNSTVNLFFLRVLCIHLHTFSLFYIHFSPYFTCLLRYCLRYVFLFSLFFCSCKINVCETFVLISFLNVFCE